MTDFPSRPRRGFGALPEPEVEANAEVAVRTREALPDAVRGGGLELTPAERRARRRNRRWMLLIAVPSIALLVAALLASRAAESNAPSGPAVSAPAGYKAVNDGYFSYVVPASWSTNGEYTDSTGDVDTSGSSGWAAEHIGYRTTPPVLGEPRPSSIAAFGMPRPEPYSLVGGHPVEVKGAASAFAYTLSRPGFSATVVDAWESRSDVELWLVVHAPPDVSGRVVSSLRS